MKIMLVGVQDMNFTTQDKSVIDGVKLHYLTVDASVYGHKATSKFISRNVFNSIGVSIKELTEVLGTEINVEFNEGGRISGVEITPAGKKEK